MAINWSGGAQGAVGGGMAGAPAGPWGAAIGAGIGGLLGAFGGGNSDEEEMRRRSNGRAPQMDPAAQSRYSAFRGNQSDLIAMLEAQARGEGPSLAQAQLQAATDRNQKGQQALAAGAQGPNAMLAQFQAMQNSSGLGMQAAQDAAMARMQEQYNAQNQLGLTLHGARGMDEANNQFNAAALNQHQYGNLQARMEGRGQNNSMLMNAYNAGQQPGLGERLLAGGAGAFSQYATQQGNQPQGGGMQAMGAPGPAPQGPGTGLFARPGFAPL